MEAAFSTPHSTRSTAFGPEWPGSIHRNDQVHVDPLDGSQGTWLQSVDPRDPRDPSSIRRLAAATAAVASAACCPAVIGTSDRLLADSTPPLI